MSSALPRITEHRGSEDGPTIALIGGVHGDEEQGVIAVQRVCAALLGLLERGTVRAVAPANPSAYQAQTRTSPVDGLDLARCFPGRPDGSPTERLAHHLTGVAIEGADLVVDLHSAGLAYSMPLLCGYADVGGELGSRSSTAARAFGAPIVWAHPGPPPPGRTLAAAHERGIPSIYVEGDGGGTLESEEIAAYVDGVLAVLAEWGMLPSGKAATRPAPRVALSGSGDLDAGVRAARRGRFVTSCRAGDRVSAGQLLAEIVDEAGYRAERFLAPRDAMMVFLRRRARVERGDRLYALASIEASGSAVAR